MSFVKIDRNNFEYTGLKLRPNVTFVSSSVGEGVTGTNFVAPVRSKCLKQVIPSNFDLNNDGEVTTGEKQHAIHTSPLFFNEGSQQFENQTKPALRKCFEGVE